MKTAGEEQKMHDSAISLAAGPGGGPLEGGQKVGGGEFHVPNG